ncbi:TPA: hypothetical protein ACWV7H_005104, partial [Salmonella enterica subsp. enterica serovar Muenchen]
VMTSRSRQAAYLSPEGGSCFLSAGGSVSGAVIFSASVAGVAATFSVTGVRVNGRFFFTTITDDFLTGPAVIPPRKG